MKTKPPTMIDITPRVRFYNKKDITQKKNGKPVEFLLKREGCQWAPTNR